MKDNYYRRVIKRVTSEVCKVVSRLGKGKRIKSNVTGRNKNWIKKFTTGMNIMRAYCYIIVTIINKILNIRMWNFFVIR
mgnify:CR=1 FL=1